MIKAEQETIIRWDQEERLAHLYTAYPPEARRWERLGYPVRVYSRTQNGTPRTWAADVPIAAIRLRRLQDGQLVRRRGHQKGRVFGPERDQVVASEAERGTPVRET